MTTWRIEGEALAAFYAGIDGEVPAGVLALEIRCEADGVRVSVNDAEWSAPLGVAR